MAVKKPKLKAQTERPDIPKSFFTLFKRDVLLLANEHNREFAKTAQKELKEVIRRQKYKWEPLTDKYLEAKKKKGLDTRILMATKDYVNKGIVVEEREGFIFVGPKIGVHKPSGLTYERLAKIHEYGTKDGRIPARPLWRPVLSVLLRRRKSYRKAYREGHEKAAMRRNRLIKQKKVK